MSPMGKPKGESRGLAFLQNRRPAAMEHLLSFFAESARHLEPKTRFLISVVTKVISGSERGIRQYVKRALETGASPDEVIDAVLCAYPCAGLTKVVDAVDSILDMGIEGIGLPPTPEEAASTDSSAEVQSPPKRAEAPSPANNGWISAGKASEIPSIGGKRVISGLRDIAVFAVDGEIVAIDNRCPHKGGSLAEGVVVEGKVVCPLHAWRFDLSSGRCTDGRAAVRTYPVRREGDEVFIGTG